MTNAGKKLESPFKLNMSFGEALNRFIVTDSKKVFIPLAIRKTQANDERPKMLTWTKILSITDAQQETTGGLVPYLRLTQSDLKGENFQTWFRQKFFAGAAWVPGVFGQEHVEEAQVPFDISISGLNIGTEALLVTHGSTRQDKHSAPNTWLHWSPNIQQILERNNFAAKLVRLTREPTGRFRLSIADPADVLSK